MATYYIAGAAGSESNNGLSDSAPKRDFSASIGVADGDVVLLRRGTQIQLTADRYPAGNYTIEAYGPDSDPLPELLIPAGQYQLTHAGTTAGKTFTMRYIKGTTTGTSNTGALFNATKAATCVAEHLEIGSPFQYGIRLGYGDNNAIRFNTISQTITGGLFSGFTATAHGSYGVYEYNVIDGRTCVTGDAFTFHDGVSGAGFGNVIRFNDITSGPRYGIGLTSVVTGTIMYGNMLRCSDVSLAQNAVVMSDSPLTMYANILWGGIQTPLQLKQSSTEPAVSASGSLLHSNVVFGGATAQNGQFLSFRDTTGIEAYYNTFIASANATAHVVQFQNGSGHLVKNNAMYFPFAGASPWLYQLISYTPGAGEIDYNYYAMGNPSSATAFNQGAFSAWQTSGLDLHSAVGGIASMLITPDGRPLPNSPLLGAGTYISTVTRDFDLKQRRNPPAIGAFDQATFRH